MTEQRTLSAQLRDRVGTGAARAARRAGNVPGVIYGGERDPASIIVSAKELVRQMEAGGFTNTLMELQADGKTQQVLPREVQLDPVTDRPIHVDFLRVDQDTKVAIRVPVTWIGTDESPGLKRGGVVNVVRHTIALLCPAGNIPPSIECNIAGLDIGDGIHFSDITLPEGVVAKIKDRDFTIVTIAAPSALVSERDEEEEEELDEEALAALEAEGEGEAGETAKPDATSE